MEIVIRNPVTWMVYAAIYVVSFAGLTAFLWLGLEQQDAENLVDLLAKAAGASLGIALFAALSWEVIKSMVLFAPMLRKKFIDQGREEGQKAERQRWEAWLKRRDEAEANNRPFNEPPPSETQ